MGIERFTRARDRLLRLADGEAGAGAGGRPPGPDVGLVLDEALAALHAVAGFAGGGLMIVDPQTLLPTGGLVEGFPSEACTRFWDNELLAPGFNKFDVLARSTDPVGTLAEATDGDPARAPIHTDRYAPYGFGDELRAAFVVGTTCWGVAALARPAADGPFPAHEVDDVRRLAPLVARALRAAACALEAGAHGPAAMVVLDGENRIQNLTMESRALLDDLRTAGVHEPDLPSLVGTVATRARAARSSSYVVTRVHGSSGRWLRVTAEPMETGDGHVGVMLEPARPSDLAPILLDTYSLTPREIEIVLLLARGKATEEIAAEVGLSAHTVRDHVKSIVDKTGAASRGELVARLFCDHLLDGFHGALRHVERGVR